MTAYSRHLSHSRPRKDALAACAASAAVAVLVTALSACGSTSTQPPHPKPTALAAHQKELDAIATWVHGDGDQLYQQYISAMKAWIANPTQADAETWWQMAGISAEHPPPVGTAQFVAALTDWEKAAQLAGGDPGAPTGRPARVLHWVKAGTRHINEAKAELPSL
jgi:hypothetical protein